jgi:hypothetical protein
VLAVERRGLCSREGQRDLAVVGSLNARMRWRLCAELGPTELAIFG